VSQAVRASRVLVVASLLAAPVTAVAQQGPDRTVVPALERAADLQLPPVQRHTLSNGLAVWLVESREVPIVQVNLVVKAGGGRDPAGKFGLASLTAAMLDEGAGSRSALEIAEEIEFLGADLSTTSTFDASMVRLGVPAARLADALGVMADVVLRPTFPAAELDRLRQERLTALLQARDDPASVAPAAFARLLFGSAHRYGTGATGTRTTLEGFTTEDLRAFHAEVFHPANAAVIVTGDVTAAGVLPLLEAGFGAWPAVAGSTAGAALAGATQPARREVVIVDMPGAAQSQIRIGWIGVPRSTPDYFTLEVLNTILGGSFTSRLNQNLREEHGYTYGAGSRFDMRASAGPFFAAAGVQTDKTSESLQEFFNELDAIGAAVGPDELTKAKNYLALGFPAEFETSRDLAAQLEQLIVYGLPDDYFSHYVKNVQAVTSDAVQKAAAAYIQPDRFLVVVAGDRKVIEAGVRALELGPVRTLSVEEVMD
jgi:predicted Zn-dependent peptidase